MFINPVFFFFSVISHRICFFFSLLSFRSRGRGLWPRKSCSESFAVPESLLKLKLKLKLKQKLKQACVRARAPKCSLYLGGTFSQLCS